MLMAWQEIIDFLLARTQEIADTEFDQIRFANVDMAFWLSIIVALAALLTLARVSFKRRKHHRHHSGHLIDRRFQRGPVVRMLYNVPKALLALAVAGVSVALADPFLMATDEVQREVESRVRIDLVDTSLSMAWEFSNAGRSRAESRCEEERAALTVQPLMAWQRNHRLCISLPPNGPTVGQGLKRGVKPRWIVPTVVRQPPPDDGVASVLTQGRVGRHGDAFRSDRRRSASTAGR